MRAHQRGRQPAEIFGLRYLYRCGFTVVGAFLIIKNVLPSTYTVEALGKVSTYTNTGCFIATISGLIAGLIISKTTEYYTSGDYKPVKQIAESCLTGTATNIISGIGMGMFSTAIPILAVCAAIASAFTFAGLYGLSLAAVGMLCTRRYDYRCRCLRPCIR